ncbi:hypothetical protein JCM3766R1_002279 [Sporobolomyces carnicolor]
MSSNKRESCSPPASSDESSSFLEAPAAGRAPACRPVIRDPLWKLRRTNTAVGSLGGACLSVGSSLVIALYVTGPPRLDDLATSVTAILLFTLVTGCAASLPSTGVASVILLGEKPSPDTFPPHARLLRALCLGSTLVATLFAILALVLYVLLQERESFIDFCLLNLKDATEAACTARWNRNWLIILSVALVLLYHVAFGFALYRYTRGPQGGTQLEEGFLLELSHRQRRGEQAEAWVRRSSRRERSEESASETGGDDPKLEGSSRAREQRCARRQT